MALSFASDIRPMFTAMDQDHMLNQIGLFDLWNYSDVKSNAPAILNAVQSGSMPPSDSGEPPWTPGQVAKFKQWMDENSPP